MKPIMRVAALLTALTAVSGCQDDFLTEVPSDFVAPETFYNNAGDALAAVNAAYATFVNLTSPLGGSDYLGRNLYMLVEYPTEVTTSRLSATNERSLIGNFNAQFSSSHPYLETVWQAAYSGINRANSVIDRVPDVEMDATRKAQIIGEAKFLRAVHYYWLAGLFGGVPLKLTETATIEGGNLARATTAETYAQITKDLTEAAAALPTSWPTGDYGRATKGAALTLLGKAYLQHAGAYGVTADYQRALDALRQVTGYSLDANYASLFDGSNERSPEIIWSIQNVRVDGYGGTLTEWFSPITSPQIFQGGAQNQFQAERPFYDSYAAADVRKAGTWLTSITYNGKTVNWAWTSGVQTATNYGSTGPGVRKYADFAAADGGAEGPDYVMLRYADVLLSTAEAINEVSGPTAEAYTLVNRVRTRAGLPNLTAGLAKAAFKDSLFAERRWELAMEMHGVFDSRRHWTWAKSRIQANVANFSTLNRSPFTSSTEKFAAAQVIDDKWRVYPIPARACELNQELAQNAGWTDVICK
ncbi:MAG: RagB/SusD family nutrient uptake outer membrane protein [Gemmatirosa sp.]